MKKSMNFKTMLGALVLLLAFTGCHKDPELSSIALKPTAITLTPGQTTRLAVIVDPVELEASVIEQITWTSSDESVVKVSGNGTLTAIAGGTANITATYKGKDNDFTGVCAVTVKDYLETLSFTGAFVYDYDTTYSQKLDTLRSESWGDQYYVAKKVLCHFMAFTAGFYINDDGYLSGASKGAILTFDAPFYWAPKWANKGAGTIFILGDWIITDDYTNAPDSTTTVGRPFSIDNAKYASSIDKYVQDYFVDGDQNSVPDNLKKAASYITGATLKVYEYHSVEEGYSSDGYFSPFVPDLLIGNGGLIVDGDYSASKYMCSITAYDFSGVELLDKVDTISGDAYIYGIHFKEEAESIDLIENKIYYGKDYHYSYGVEAAAPRKVAALKPEYKTLPVHELSPEVKARIREQLGRKDVMNKK